MKRSACKRRGAVLATTLVLLAAMAVVMGSLTWQTVNQRRLLSQREKMLQAEWLARSGVEHTHAQIKAGKEPVSGSWSPLPNAEVRIAIREGSGTYEVRCEATYPTDEPRPVSRQVEVRIAK